MAGPRGIASSIASPRMSGASNPISPLTIPSSTIVRSSPRMIGRAARTRSLAPRTLWWNVA